MKKLLLLALLFVPASSLAALRTKTIEYSFYMSTESVAGGTSRQFLPITVNIPETTSRTFVDVQSYVCVIDSQAAAGSPTSVTTSVKIDAVAASTVTVVDTINNTGEHMSYIFLSTFTKYFNDNFTGTSHTVNLVLTLSINQTDNASGKLIITYEYDDSATTRIKTVRIPIQSSTSTLKVTQEELWAAQGLTNQVPALDTYLPEQSKTFRDIFLETHINDSVTGTGGSPTGALCVQLDSDPEVCDGAHIQALASARYYYGIWKNPSMTTSSAHAIKARTTNTAVPFTNIGFVLVATYEYNHTTSTEIFNSVMIAAADEDGFSGGTAEADKSRFSREITIAEVNPVLKQSGVLFSHADNAGTVILMKSGTRVDYTTYTMSNVNYSGGRTFVHRVDNSDGFSLARGTNTFTLDWYRTSATGGQLASNPSALLYLNYVSSKSASPGGDANHMHTVIYNIQPWAPDASLVEANSFAPIIRESNYWITSAGYWILFSQGVASSNINLSAEIASGEFTDEGWRGFYNGSNISDPEWGAFLCVSRSADSFKKHPLDPAVIMDIETARKYRFQTVAATAFMQGSMFITYRSSTYTITGTLSNYSGDGSGVSIRLFRSDTDEYVSATTSASGGTFVLPWYENTVPVYIVAYQSATKKGRSANGIAGTDTFDIDLQPTGGGGGQTSHTFGN